MTSKWMDKFSIQQKLLRLLGIGVLGCVLYFIGNTVILVQNQRIMTGVVKSHLPMLEATEQLGRALSDMKTGAIQAALTGNMDGIAELGIQNSKVLASFNNLDQVSHHTIGNLDKNVSSYKAAYKGTTETLQNLVAGLEKLGAAQSDLQKDLGTFGKLQAWVKTLKEKQSVAFKASVQSADMGSRRAMEAGLALLIAIIPFALIVYYITREVTNGLQTVSERLSGVSQNMLKISEDVSHSSQKLATAASKQTSSVSGSVSRMDEMRAMLGQTVQHSGEALKSSEDSYREASDGRIVIDNLKSAMEEIKRSYEQLEEVNRVVQKIRDRTAVINDIVFETQILSFNASIEAARAGQQGHGFAVVAAEIGKLAEMSGKAAEEIRELLGQSTKQVAEIVESTKDKVGSANLISQSCAEVFGRIIERAAEVKAMVTSITDATAKQESGIHQIGQAMNDMRSSASESDKMAHTMAKLSDTLKGHSQSLAGASQNLDQLVHGERGFN